MKEKYICEQTETFNRLVEPDRNSWIENENIYNENFTDGFIHRLDTVEEKIHEPECRKIKIIPLKQRNTKKKKDWANE